jgi:hypothetical protein
MRAIFQRSFTMTIVIPALLILMLVGSAPVSAISVSGAKYMNSISPGGTDIQKMTVGIGGDEDPTDVMVEVLGFGQTRDLVYTTLSPVNDRSPYSARAFITLDTNTIHLEPGAKKEVTATITLPKNYLHPCHSGKGKIIYHCGKCSGTGHCFRFLSDRSGQYHPSGRGQCDHRTADFNYHLVQKYRELPLLSHRECCHADECKREYHSTEFDTSVSICDYPGKCGGVCRQA